MAVDLSLKTRRASALDMTHDKGEPNHASSVRCIRNSGDQSQNEIGSRPAAKTVMGSTPAESGGRVQFRIENILSGGISSETDKSSTEKYASDFGYVPPRQEVRQQFRHVTGAIGSEHRIAPRNQVLQIARDLNSYDVISYQPAHQAGAYHRDALPVCCVHTSTGSIPRLSLTAAPLAQTDIQMSERVWHPQSDGGSYPEEAKYDAGSSVMIYPTESNRLHEFVLRDHKRKANYIAPSDGSERLRAIENGGAVIVPDPSGLHPDIGYQPTNVAAYPGSSRLVHVPAGVRQSSTMIIHSASMPPSGIEPHSAMVQHSGMASHSGMVPHCGMASAGLVQPSDLPRPSISMNATGTYPDSNLIQTQQMTCPRGDKPTPQFDLYSESADYRILPGAVATPVGQSYNNMMQWVPPDYHGLPRSRIMKEAFRDDKCVDRQPTRAEKRLCPHPPPVDVICGPKAKLYEASWQETAGVEFKRPRTSFTDFQLLRLKAEFRANCYLSEERRLALANELGLGENQVKIWFQNNRAKLKKASYQKNSDSSRVDGIYTS